MPGPSELYFAVGSEAEPYSSVWKVWTHRGQVYLAPRESGRWLKMSLHTPDTWMAAWTSESEIVNPEHGQRRERTWRRPPEFTPGWTQGPTIAVPRTHEAAPFPITLPKKAPTIRWIRPPEVGEKVMITLLFQSAETRQPLRPGDEMVGKLALDTGETLWLAVRREPLGESERAWFTKARDEIKVHPGDAEDTIEGASVFVIDENEAGPFWVDMALGPDNVGAPR